MFGSHTHEKYGGLEVQTNITKSETFTELETNLNFYIFTYHKTNYITITHLQVPKQM